MKYDDFVNQAHTILEMPDRARTIRTIRAVLTTLGERLHPDEAKDLASNLPMEIDRFLIEADSGQRFNYREFVERVSDREKSDGADAAYHAQQLVELLAESVPEGEIRQVINALPEDFEKLFERVPRSSTEQ